MADDVERAHTAIRQGILEGRYPPGTTVEPATVAGEVGVAEDDVEAAVQRLIAEGMLETVPGRGSMVASWGREELEEIFDLRTLLESYAAELAAGRVDDATIGRLRELADRMEEAAAGDDDDRMDRIATLNNTFHALIVGAAANRHLTRLLEGLQQVPLVHRTFRRYDERALERSMSHHRELIDALVAGNGTWAATIARAHIQSAKAVIDAG